MPLSAPGKGDAVADDQETRTAILAAARAALAGSGKFTLRDLGVSRAVTKRLFGGRDGVMAALAAEDLKNLSGIIAAPDSIPMPLPQAVGAGENIFYIDSNAAPAPREPRLPRHGEIGKALEERQVRETETAMKAETEAGRAPDAWLERRLRVFERALNNIEFREEKSERDRMSGLSILEEGLRQMQDALKKNEVEHRTASAELRGQMDELTLRIGALEIARIAAAPAPEPLRVESNFSPLADCDIEAITVPAQEEEAHKAPKTVDAPMDHSFIAQARRSAQAAAQLAAETPEPAKPDPLRFFRNRWALAAALAALFLIATASFALGEFAQPAAAPRLAVNGVTHLHPALSGAERLRVLADGGNAQARTLVALHYLRGEGVPQSDAAAARWARMAATQGDAVAQYVLATLYHQGSGVPQDSRAAFGWFEAAALQGNRKAMHDLAIAYAQGQGVQKNPQEAAHWFARAALLGYVDSQFDLAVLYERGEGVPQSLNDAYKWYAIAAAQGDAPSASRIDALRTQLPPAVISAEQREAGAFVPLKFDAGANNAPDRIAATGAL
jgi:TPR repeat protein